MDKFNKNSLYIFNKEKYRQHTGKVTPLVELLHNMIVDTEDEHIGTVTVNREEYIVFPHYCIEISPEVYSDEEGNIYNTYEDIEDEQQENIRETKELTQFLNKLFQIGEFDDDKEYTLSFSNEKEMEDITKKYNERIEKFDLSKRYVFDKTLIGADINADDWIDRLDGKEVDVRNELLGYIYDEVSRFQYFISPRWCRIIEDK